MAKKPITKPLFSFVTLRSPQLLSKEEKDKGFIYFPTAQKSNSYFLKDLDAQPDSDGRRTFLEGRTATFSAITKREDVEVIKPDLYEFSIWLMRKKDTLTINEINTKLITPVPTLTLTQERNLWDNLFYQLLTQSSTALRDALVQMIVANNFIKKNDSQATGTTRFIDTNLDVRRLANAFVVIPKNVKTNLQSRSNNTRQITTQHKNYLGRQLDAFEAQQLLNDYTKAEEELQTAVAISHKESQEAFDTAYATYEADTKTAYENATKVTDPSTGLVTYQNLVLPDLNFTPVTVFDTNYLNNKTTTTTRLIFDALIAEGVNSEEDLFNRLTKKKKSLYATYLKKYKKTAKTVKYGDTVFTVNPKAPPVLTYVASTLKSISDPNEVILSINLTTAYKSPSVESNTLSLRFDDGTSLGNIEVSVVESTLDTAIISTAPNTITVPSGVKTVTISGDITLDNGEVVTIDTTVNLATNTRGTSRATSQRVAQTSTVVHNGITKIGIADFRKVEQEVCCFVPGEVSRIENLLAGEYKERATRQLLSSKTVSEVTNERETENLTDTTTTERNELSSEVATVLNEEQSQAYGASAGVSGSFGKNFEYRADAYFNGASSSSSSNSNTTAETYAKEVTERALERVVQKITRKRVTTILREYEETNKHGFDNRGNTNNVAGVYRWVDKIYTNKLVNYGKRLLYEFSIPEPSRFFKEAILQTIDPDTPQFISGIPDSLVAPEEPVFPTDISSAIKINEANYRQVAALFNAEVSPPPALYLTISKSFSFLSAIEDKDEYAEKASGNEDIEIPEGYNAKKVKYSLRLPDENNIGMSVTIADVTEIGIRNTTKNGTIFLSGGNSKNKLPISYWSLGYNAGSFNCVIYCQRSLQAYQQWQNETYKAIRDAYQERVNEYNDFLFSTFEPQPQQGESQVVKTEFNPLLNRTLEKRELKRIAIDMMARPFGLVTARNGYSNLATLDGIPNLTNVVLSSALDKHAEVVKFFEQAFDWEIMAYTFYPYFYGGKADWTTLFRQSNGTDPIFQAFLQSGMARAVVPIKPGFEKAVTYFFETGDVFIGDQIALDRDDDLYLSIAEETQQTEGVVEKEWETRVPTALTIVQANAAPLNENGLPCCTEGTNDSDRVGYGTSTLVPKPDPATP